jgi:hypothetical protein
VIFQIIFFFCDGELGFNRPKNKRFHHLETWKKMLDHNWDRSLAYGQAIFSKMFQNKFKNTKINVWAPNFCPLLAALLPVPLSKNRAVLTYL